MNRYSHLRVLALVSLVPICMCRGIWAQNQPPGDSAKSDKVPIARLSEGTISGNTYHNSDLGLSYEFPSGWSISDRKTQQQAISNSYQFVWTEDIPREKMQHGTQCARSLLFVSKYPELMRANEFNAFAILIAADPRCIPGASVPASIKDQQAIQRIATNVGAYFKTSGLNSLDSGRIQAFDWGGRVAFELRQRFRVTTQASGTITSMEVITSTLVMPFGQFWTMCMSVGADDTQMKALRATKIFFDPLGQLQ